MDEAKENQFEIVLKDQQRNAYDSAMFDSVSELQRHIPNKTRGSKVDSFAKKNTSLVKRNRSFKELNGQKGDKQASAKTTRRNNYLLKDDNPFLQS